MTGLGLTGHLRYTIGDPQADPKRPVGVSISKWGSDARLSNADPTTPISGRPHGRPFSIPACDTSIDGCVVARGCAWDGQPASRTPQRARSRHFRLQQPVSFRQHGQPWLYGLCTLYRRWARVHVVCLWTPCTLMAGSADVHDQRAMRAAHQTDGVQSKPLSSGRPSENAFWNSAMRKSAAEACHQPRSFSVTAFARCRKRNRRSRAKICYNVDVPQTRP